MKSLKDQKDKEGHYYYPAGVPVTPQARRIGYEFPVYVSMIAWKKYCAWAGASRLGTSADRRIFELLQYCYEGMLKRLAREDDFVFYYFKVWYWPSRATYNVKKKKRARLGARLFLDPDTGNPWLYIFDPERDTADQLKQGEAPDEEVIQELRRMDDEEGAELCEDAHVSANADLATELVQADGEETGVDLES